MQTEPTLVIMAGGLSRRFGRLKQVEPVGPNSECLLDFTAYDAIRAGFTHIVLVIRSEIEAEIRQTVGARLEAHIRVSYVLQDQASELGAPERAKPWGTGHAALAALKATGSASFGVINVDDLYGANTLQLLHDQLIVPNHSALVGYRLKNTLLSQGTAARGICSVDAAGNLTNVKELTEIGSDDSGIFSTTADGRRINLTGDEIVSVNTWAVSPAAATGMLQEWQKFIADYSDDQASEFYLPNSIGNQITAGTLEVALVETNDIWHGITHPGDEVIVSQHLTELSQQGVYPNPLWG